MRSKTEEQTRKHVHFMDQKTDCSVSVVSLVQKAERSRSPWYVAAGKLAIVACGPSYRRTATEIDEIPAGQGSIEKGGRCLNDGVPVLTQAEWALLRSQLSVAGIQ